MVETPPAVDLPLGVGGVAGQRAERLLDLALGVEGGAARNFFLVAPDNREEDVRAQFARPAFSRVAELDLRYLPYSELRGHRETIARFGSGLKGVLAIAKPVGRPR